jgi:hypothetical protein
MGIEAWITVIPRNERRKKRRSPDLPQFDLHKDWSWLQSVLDEIGGLAARALRGHDPLAEEYDLDVECYLITPPLVKRISKALGAISDDQLIATINGRVKKFGWRLRKYEHKYRLAAFKTLKDAYSMAARKDAYLEVLIGG